MNDQVKTILESITVGGNALPIALLHFDGQADIFAVYSPTNEGVGLSGDNVPLEYVEAWDIDLYSKGDYLVLSTQIKQAFIDAGWVYKGRGQDTYDTDTKYYHRLLEFEKEVA